MMIFWSQMMSQKSQNKKVRKPKARNWMAVHAFLRPGAGKHKDKSKYTRKSKHKVSYS